MTTAAVASVRVSGSAKRRALTSVPPPMRDRRASVLLLVVLLLAAAADVGLPTAAARAVPVGREAGTYADADAGVEVDVGVGVGAGRAWTVGRRASPVGGRAWPVGGRDGLLRRFDAPAARWAPGHRGVDLAASPGVPVRAAAPGVVSFSGMVAGRPVVSVTHPGSGDPPLRTTYLPVAGSLPVGTEVSAGEIIGEVGAGTGHCASGCLHWGLLRGSRYLDPLALLGSGRARLLPLDASPLRPGEPPGGGPQPSSWRRRPWREGTVAARLPGRASVDRLSGRPAQRMSESLARSWSTDLVWI
ncbi:M23 family metallopeptidase [Kitasatospora paracochleata]|uniref:Murein DD-endopeptidase MepM/ murein hydrolase activator NlpD n=1 Tax=Kitasatospora paracochleata TaxID=58354 RepID=A0ABT1IRM8_9ACTN|nr:M23 family metallopeptidase [Kitasatospora paracochleata]MCP2307772.1 murein DD-endopeptidase MepM/ murein hydrolase activator NlpD [Kitasatospora paracochleata]